jgi:hypothetical protein
MQALKIITHSHGATFITTTLINTYSKMGISKSNFEKSKSKYPGNRYILSRYNKTKIPIQKIQVFMNAPANTWYFNIYGLGYCAF